MVEGEEKICPTMSALAILSCRPNSHPFQERHISLHEVVKIGRSVARARPSASNGIFDCKVLSRHHAMLWYETGKFYLQDTKSSNGTFINNQRLCKGGEESQAREVYSGDIIQLGVEVMENNRRGEKITHGCIIATINLYHPDGRESKPTLYLCGENLSGISLQTQDLYQLAQYLQEALHREKMLEQKLLTLQQLVHNTQKASESGWQALIDEDKLLSRLEMLENQLHIYSKNHSEDTLRQELVDLQEDKNKYETTSKESLRRVLQEKLEAVTKLSDLEQSLDNIKDECGHLKEVCESSQSELGQLAEKYQQQLKEVADLQEKLQEAEQNHATEQDRSEQEKSEISQKLEEMIQQETSLSAQIESLQADNDFTKEQLSSMKTKLESMKESNEDDQKLAELVLNSSITEEINIIPLDPPKEDYVPENLEAKLKDLQKLIEVYKGKLEDSDIKLKESNDKVEQLQKNLEVALSNSEEYLVKMTSLEDKVKLSDFHMNEMMENALLNLKLQLKESAKQSNSSNYLIEAVKDHILQVEKELTFQTPVNSVVNSTESLDSSQNERFTSSSQGNNDNTEDQPTSPSSLSPASTPTTPSATSHIGGLPDFISTTMNLNGTGSSEEQDADSTMILQAEDMEGSSSVPNLEKDDGLKALLEEAQQAQNKAEIELRKIKDLASNSESRLHESSEEISSLTTQLFDARQQAKENSDLITDLQDQVKEAESFTKDVKQQILDLREQLEGERKKQKATEKDLEDAKILLATSQQNAKQNHNETEHLRDKLRHLQEELDSERNKRETQRHGNNTDRLSSRSKEYQAVKDECANLRKRIQAIEAEMKITRKENLHLSSEYNKLQESYKQLESLKAKLEISEVSWRANLTDAQKDAHLGRQNVRAGPVPTGEPAAGSVSWTSLVSSDSGLPSSLSSTPLTRSSSSTTISSSHPERASGSIPSSSQDSVVADAPSPHSGAGGPSRECTRVRLSGSPISHVPSSTSSPSILQPPTIPSSSSTLYSQLEDARTELLQLRMSCEEKTREVGSLQHQISELMTDYHSLQSKSRMVSLVSSIPLLLLLFAVLMAIYPALEAVTATFS